MCGAIAFATIIVSCSGEIVVEHEEGVKEPAFSVIADRCNLEGVEEVLKFHEEEAILGILHEINLCCSFLRPFAALVTIGS